MTSKVGPKGQVVIPKSIRDQLGLNPGDRVVFVPQEGGVRVELARPITALGGSLAGRGLTKELEKEHTREIRTRH